MDAAAVAHDVFDVHQLRAQQLEAIEAIVRGDVIAVLPTGFGKSLCYQIGTVLLKGFAVVVTPLLALSEDQIQYMLAHGIPVDRIDSTVLYDEQLAVCKRIEGKAAVSKRFTQHQKHCSTTGILHARCKWRRQETG